MSINLYHHPFTRAANVVWMLEELGLSYTLTHVSLKDGENKRPAFLARNRMGKLPLLTDDQVTVSESAAIGLYLADRYGLGTLAPALADDLRGAYLRWIFFAPSVLEPACMAHRSGWEYPASNVGWGAYHDVCDALASALAEGPWLLGERFTMADVVLGGTVRYMLQFEMLTARESFVDYAGRLSARPAALKADSINQAAAKAHGLG